MACYADIKITGQEYHAGIWKCLEKWEQLQK